MRELQVGLEQSITHRNEDSLQRYLNDLDRISLIRPEEEVLLARKIREGDSAALDKLIRSNLRFVVSCAKKYQHMGMPLSDLVSEGNAGLVLAAKKFDETKGFKFISYAVWWIRQSIMAAVPVHTRMIRLPMNVIRSTTDIRRGAERLEQLLQREPTLEEIAAEVGISEESPALENTFEKKVVSFDLQLLEGDGQAEYFPTGVPDSQGLPADWQLIDDSIRTDAHRALSLLDEREQKIMMALFGIGRDREMSMEEVALEIGMNKESIRLIKNASIKKIRDAARRKGAWYAVN